MKRPSLKKSTAFFRKQFSITQKELANYLGISYSLLAMHEKEQRTLPTKVHIKLCELVIAHDKSKKTKKTGRSLLVLQAKFDRQHGNTVKKLQGKVFLHRSKAQMLKYILTVITEKREKDRDWLNIIDDRLGALPKTASAKTDRQWLELQHDKVIERMMKANEKQAKLQLEIELLNAAADIHEAHQQRLKKGG